MAGNKPNRKQQLANRSWRLAELHQAPTPSARAEAPTPVKAHIYRALADLNGGFEKVLADLKTLGQISFFRSSSASSMHNLISHVRAQVNREFSFTLYEREMANAGYFEHLCEQGGSSPPAGESRKEQ